MRGLCVDESIGRQNVSNRQSENELAFVRSQPSAGQHNAAHGREQITGFKLKLKLNNGRVRRPRRRVHHVHRRALRHGLRGRVHRLRRVQS